MIKPSCSKVDAIFKTNLFIYNGDRAKAKKATLYTLKHNLILDGLWLPLGKQCELKLEGAY